MPWTSKSARKFTHKAKTPSQKRKWASIANAVLKKTGSESSAIKIANASLRHKRNKK